MVKVGDLEPWCPSVCAPEASEKWMILDPRTRIVAAPKKRKSGMQAEDGDDAEEQGEAKEGDGIGSAGRNVKPTDLVPLTFWSPGRGLYKELIHRFNAGAVIDLTALDNVSALASVPHGLAWTSIAQTPAHAAHLRARIAAGLFKDMLDFESPLFSADLELACRSIAPETPETMPPEVTEMESTPQKRPRLLPGYTTSHIAASDAKKKKRDQSRLRAAAVQPKAWTCMCNLLWTCPAQAILSGKRSAAAAASREGGE